MMRVIRLRSFYGGAMALACLLLVIRPALAQGAHIEGPSPRTTAELLRGFENPARTPGGGNPRAQAVSILLHRERTSPDTIRAILAGLERIALTAQDPEARMRAMQTLAIPGFRTDPHPMPGIADRLVRLYRLSDDPNMRATLIEYLGRLNEGDRVVDFLRSLLVQADSDVPSSPVHAYGALRQIGPRGIAVLREAYRAGTVRDPSARALLDAFARAGFPAQTPSRHR